MNFTLHQLNIFKAVVDLQSITKAADQLSLTQPAVSIQLKNFQDQFDLPLTEIIGRKLYVTDFGREIALRCEHILSETAEIKYTLDRYKGLVSGKIKISVVSTGKYVIPYVLRKFMDMYPAIHISLDVSNRTRVLEDMRKNECDFALVSVIPEQMQLQNKELMDNQLYLVGSAEFKGAVQEVKDLENVTLLFREQGSATRNAMETYLSENNIKVGKSMELVSNEAVKQAVNAGLGFSIVPLIGLRRALTNEDIRIFPLDGLPITTRWNVIYHRDKRLTPAQEAFIEYLDEHTEEITQRYFNWEE